MLPNGRMRKQKDKKEKELRMKYIPGSSLEEAVECSRYYLQQELQYKHGAITRTIFFYHFARCYKAMFSYEKLTVEREQLVIKWTMLGKAKMEEKKMKGKDRKESTDGAEREKSVSRKDSKAKSKGKKNEEKDRMTAPANSISDLMQSTHSKVLQAEKKLTGTISATADEKRAQAAADREEKQDDRR